MYCFNDTGQAQSKFRGLLCVQNCVARNQSTRVLPEKQ
jgi:hypothetical protein